MDSLFQRNSDGLVRDEVVAGAEWVLAGKGDATCHTIIPGSSKFELADLLIQPPRDFDGIREFLWTHHIDAIVWHHPDGRMVNSKASDFDRQAE